MRHYIEAHYTSTRFALLSGYVSGNVFQYGEGVMREARDRHISLCRETTLEIVQ